MRGVQVAKDPAESGRAGQKISAEAWTTREQGQKMIPRRVFTLDSDHQGQAVNTVNLRAGE